MIKVQKNLIFFLFAALIPCFLSAGPAFPETEEKAGRNDQPESIVIHSKTMEMDNSLMFITFLGDVKAIRSDFVIDCDKMLAYYDKTSDQQEENGGTPNMKKIVAMGNVTINRADGGVATSEMATYFQDEDIMILTGDPTVKRGTDVVNGDRITIFLNEDRVLVEGEEKGVTVTISPAQEKK